ncbi:MAG: hypothetical protein IH851_13255 [Armatimonadetes bacterium]|nr:hypothetical protein [Armatimonadota bacterium]
MSLTAQDVLHSLDEFLKAEQDRNGGPAPAERPGHRRQFLWPRPSVSAQYNVKPRDFKRTVRFEIHGEAFTVHVAETPFGVFGKCEDLWAEAKAPNENQMLVNLRRELEPLFNRQFAISRTLGMTRRYDGAISDLPPTQLVRLLYCPDRDVAHTAMSSVEAHAGDGLYTPALIRVLQDRSHPLRRIAQWCTLDIFEDLPNVCATAEQAKEAVAAVQGLMTRAADDYARAIYKAGDVLGDHVANEDAAEALLKVLVDGPEPYGRRSAIHGLFHLCEWMPEKKEEAVAALKRASRTDPEPVLRQYAKVMIQDIVQAGPHGPEPVLPDEVV